MENKYAAIFKPGKIGNLTLKNRIVMCPMATMYAESDGKISETQLDYYEARAKGGVGMITLEGAYVSRLEGTSTGVVYLDDDKYLPRMTQLADRVHAYGARLCAEIGCGYGRIAAPLSSSAVPTVYDPSVICKPLSKEEIQSIVLEYEKAAERCRRAGFDAVEIHAHCGYLVDQFMTAAWNTRTDEYGGSLENRMRFPVELVQAIHRGAGEDMPVLFRMSADHLFEGGRRLEETIEIAKILESNGVAALDIDAGSYETMDWLFPSFYHGDACMRSGAAAIRENVSIPVMNTGNYTPDTAVDALESGDIDFVMVGRGLIADPEWVNKLRANTPEEIRPCMRCAEHCVGGLFSTTGMRCSINTQVGSERAFAVKKTCCPKKVAIIGAGPAGLEAARVAAEAGHSVTVFDKNNYIGGQLAAPATASFKTLSRLLNWYQLQMDKLGVKMCMETNVTPDSECLAEFDELIVAIGSEPMKLPIPGIDSAKVVNVIDAHLHREKIVGDDIIVMGGGLSGVDFAIELAMDGKNVTIVEMKSSVGTDAPAVRLPAMYRMFQEYGVNVLCDSRVVEINDEGVCIQSNGEMRQLKGDCVVDALGMKSLRPAAEAYLEKYPFARIIGDCDKPGKSGEAIRSGFFAAFALN